MGLVSVRDESTKVIGHRFLNSQICLWIGICQGLVVLLGIAQHGHSYMQYQKILKCDFVEGTLPLEAVDAVIFDIGLFYTLWGIRGCVAEYIDGGLGRLCWCVSHALSLTFSLPFAFSSRPRPCFLWPLLIQQSIYGICLFILFLAALPRILPLLTEPHAAPVVPIMVYFAGSTLNFFLLYIYWHWYWHVDSMWNSVVRVRFGQIVRDANRCSRRDKPMVPKEPMTFPEPLSVCMEEDEEEEEESIESDPVLSTPEYQASPARVIYATKVHPDSIENRALRAQEAAHQRPGRRRLPKTPSDQPLFFLPHTEI